MTAANRYTVVAIKLIYGLPVSEVMRYKVFAIGMYIYLVILVTFDINKKEKNYVGYTYSGPHIHTHTSFQTLNLCKP